MASSYDSITPRIQRSIRMAFIKAKVQVPVDTGTLRTSLIAKSTSDGYNIHFIDERINPKSKKKVGEYKHYADTRGKSAGYWKRFREAFYADLGTQLHSKVVIGGM